MLQQNEPTKFKKLLNDNFIYPGSGWLSNENPLGNRSPNCESLDPMGSNRSSLNSRYIETYTGNCHRGVTVYRYYYVRPVLELLFIEHNHLFRELVTNVAQSENPALHEAFHQSIMNQDIPKDIITPWDPTQKSKIEEAIREISTYGDMEKSGEKCIARARHAQELARSLGE